MTNKTMLKFRVWDNHNKRFIKSYHEIGKYFHGFCNDSNDINIGIAFWEVPDGYFRILQSTGLKDKNKSEIFEGDIVKWSDSDNPERIARVEWLNGEVHFYRINNKEFPNEKLAMNDFNMGNFIYSETDKFLEVIGNVYENEEFLRKW